MVLATPSRRPLPRCRPDRVAVRDALGDARRRPRVLKCRVPVVTRGLTRPDLTERLAGPRGGRAERRCSARGGAGCGGRHRHTRTRACTRLRGCSGSPIPRCGPRAHCGLRLARPGTLCSPTRNALLGGGGGDGCVVGVDVVISAEGKNTMC